MGKIDNEPLTEEERRDIKIALDNVKKGKVYCIEDVARKLGIKLK